jgi:hypothetical protein
MASGSSNVVGLATTCSPRSHGLGCGQPRHERTDLAMTDPTSERPLLVQAKQRAQERLPDLGWFGKVVASFGAAALLYVIGGIAMLMRLLHANLAVSESLTVTSHNDLLILGIRECAAALVLAAVCYALAAWSWKVYAGAVVVLAVLAPATPAGRIWVGALVAIGVASYLARRSGAGDWRLWLPVIVFALTTIAVVCRYLDPPDRFDQAGVYVQDVGPGPGCMSTDLRNVLPSYCGYYLGADSDSVFIGRDLDEAGTRGPVVVVLPRSSVSKVLLFKRPALGTPAESWLGHLVERWSSTDTVQCDPLECWVGGRTFGNQLFG